MQTMYEIPIIPNNLRHEETIIQIADVLNYVYNVFDDILLRINKRIDKNKTLLLDLTERIDKSSEKIIKLTGTKKATQVFSCSKYPASEVHKHYKAVFNNEKMNFKRSKMKSKNIGLLDNSLEKLQFYHVKINDKYINNKYISVEEGLGSFPNNIESINELLLFNTNKNPYKNYVMSDPLQMIQHIREVGELSVAGPDAAPLSISQRAALNRSVGENYFYSPGLGDVPTIDVPLDLPDLPGVADDLRYLMESGPGIAPSVTTTPIVPDLPSIIQSPTEISDSKSNKATLTESLPVPPLPHSLTPDLATVDDLKEIQTEIQQEKFISSQNNITTSEEQTSTNLEKNVKQDPLPVVEDARASLMAAIRQAGGMKNAKLRNTDTKKENDNKYMNSQGSSYNLMADLNAKLALRRKGISGTKMSDGSEMNSALSRVSAMIPPPPPVANEPNESTNTEDEDWDE